MGGLLVEEGRAPWWKWALLSLTSSVAVVLLLVPTALYLMWQGVDLLEYVEVARPTLIRDGLVGGALTLLLAGQAVGPLLVVPFFGPARRLLSERLRPPARWGGLVGRVLLGAVLFAGLQLLWDAYGPATEERWRIVEHITYAVTRGGQFWPLFWFLLGAGVVIPVGEEMLFRGILFPMARRRWRFAVAGVVSALLFGLPHGWPNAIPAALFGFYLAYQVEQDRSLYGAMALHALNNLGALLVLIAQWR